ncbi:MAG: hypothetical protein ACI80V_003586 [Rhodothermales bacterium]|jgi:hypothetical protein
MGFCFMGTTWVQQVARFPRPLGDASPFLAARRVSNWFLTLLVPQTDIPETMTAGSAIVTLLRPLRPTRYVTDTRRSRIGRVEGFRAAAVTGVQLRFRRERENLKLEDRVTERMVSLLRSSSRIVDAAAGIAAALLIVGGLLGPDLHRLVHHQEHQSSSAETCEFDGQGAHFEEDWVQASHGDCTLCERVQVSIYDADVSGPDQEDVRTRFRPHRADGLGGSDGDVRGRSPPMKV